MAKNIHIEIPVELSSLYNRYTAETIMKVSDVFAKFDKSKLSKMSLEKMIDARNRDDIASLIDVEGIGHNEGKFVLEMLFRFFFLRNVISDKKAIDFGIQEPVYYDKLAETARGFHNQVLFEKFGLPIHIKYTAFSQFSALYSCFLSLGILPDDLTIDTFVYAGKGLL